MAKLGDLLTSLFGPGWDRGHSRWRRALAAALSVTLLLANLAPAVAAAAEPDSEAEGSAPPGAVESSPDVEAGGEETALEEAAGSQPGVGAEDTGEGPPLEADPAVEPTPSPPAAVTGAAAGATPEGARAAPEAGSIASAPELERGPAGEAAPANAAPTPVKREPLSAPEAAPPERKAPRPQRTTLATPQPPAPPPPASAPAEEPEPAPAQPAAVPVARSYTGGGGLAGHRSHVVRPGESLWSIAKGMLPAGASNAAVAREVRRLWRLNAGRIGTGDPSLLIVGTRLRLS